MERQNKHHVFWQRRDYRDPVGKELRNHTGLIVPMYISAHGDLHADLFPPPKPHRNLALGILNNLEDHHLTDPLDGLLFTIEYVEDKDARLTKHLIQQLGYMGVEL